MSRPLRLAALVLAAAGTLALGGCRGGAAAAPTAPAAVSPGSSAGLDSPGTSAGGSAGTSADPLGSVESSLAAIEKQIDQDGTG